MDLTFEDDDSECEYCGEPRIADFFEYFPEDRSWMWDTCCEGMQQELNDDLNHAFSLPPSQRRKYLKTLTRWFDMYGIPCRNLFSDMGHAEIDYGLTLNTLPIADACAFVAEHHDHNEAPKFARWAHGIWNGPDLVGVAVVGNPVARMIATREPKTMEVVRMCTNRSVAPEMTA